MRTTNTLLTEQKFTGLYWCEFFLVNLFTNIWSSLNSISSLQLSFVIHRVLLAWLSCYPVASFLKAPLSHIIPCCRLKSIKCSRSDSIKVNMQIDFAFINVFNISEYHIFSINIFLAHFWGLLLYPENVKAHEPDTIEMPDVWTTVEPVQETTPLF